MTGIRSSFLRKPSNRDAQAGRWNSGSLHYHGKTYGGRPASCLEQTAQDHHPAERGVSLLHAVLSGGLASAARDTPRVVLPSHSLNFQSQTERAQCRTGTIIEQGHRKAIGYRHESSYECLSKFAEAGVGLAQF